MWATTSAEHGGAMLPPTTALMILQTHDDEIERTYGRTARLRRRRRRFEQQTRLRRLLA